MSAESLPDALPILTLRNTVLYPGSCCPSPSAATRACNWSRTPTPATASSASWPRSAPTSRAPDPDDLYRVGAAATILKLIKMPDGSVSIVIQGKRRIEVQDYVQLEPVPPRPDPGHRRGRRPRAMDPVELDARVRTIKELAVQIVNLSPNLP